MPKMAQPSSDFSTLHLPVLSIGRHRNSRKGACFMEYASVLAGERWSDHPACTHAAVAALARAVNDCTSDSARSALAPLIPSVIGLTVDAVSSRDEQIAVLVAAMAGTAALPIASESRQRTIAVGLLYARTLAERTGLPDAANVRRAIDEALASAPLARDWATTFSSGLVPKSGNSRHAMRVLTTVSVLGIADACVPDADARLERLLRESIDATTALLKPQGVESVPSRKSDPAFANA